MHGKKGYTEAKAYFEAHKNLDVPTTYITASGYKLGRWIANQRAKGKKKLSPKRQECLDEIGMIWEKQDSWETRYKLAAEYFAAHGNLRVPAQYKADGVWLNKWLNEQRQIYAGKRAGKSLSIDQIHRLTAIGMDLGVIKYATQPVLLPTDEQKKGLLPMTGWRNVGQDSFVMPQRRQDAIATV